MDNKNTRETDDAAEDLKEIVKERVKQIHKTMWGIRSIAHEARHDMGDDGVFDELMAIADRLERQAATLAGHRPYQVRLEFGPVYAVGPEEAAEECLCGGVTPSDKNVEELAEHA